MLLLLLGPDADVCLRKGEGGGGGGAREACGWEGAMSATCSVCLSKSRPPNAMTVGVEAEQTQQRFNEIQAAASSTFVVAIAVAADQVLPVH